MDIPVIESSWHFWTPSDVPDFLLQDISGDGRDPSHMCEKKGSFNSHLGGGFKYFFISIPTWGTGEMIQFDEHIFQMGGSTTNQPWFYYSRDKLIKLNPVRRQAG